jgi:hypothetical protein
MWQRISAPFRKEGVMVERAHKDGMKISYDSPEAFEEIIWQYYLEDKIIQGDHIALLADGDQTPEFEKGIRETIAKLLINQEGKSDATYRYLSKNNANISRTRLIRKIFPSCTIVICFRDPLAQAASLIKQHTQFTERHKTDKYARRYMRWLGHYDFGLNFKPINFDNWLEGEDLGLTDTPAFWIRYWTAAYSYVIENIHDGICLVDFEKMLGNGTTVLGNIADRLELRNKENLVRVASTLRAPTSRPLLEDQVPEHEMAKAREIHEVLKGMAL